MDNIINFPVQADVVDAVCELEALRLENVSLTMELTITRAGKEIITRRMIEMSREVEALRSYSKGV